MHCLVWLETLVVGKGRAGVPVPPSPRESQREGGAGFSSVDRRVSFKAQLPLVKAAVPTDRGR